MYFGLYLNENDTKGKKYNDVLDCHFRIKTLFPHCSFPSIKLTAWFIIWSVAATRVFSAVKISFVKTYSLTTLIKIVRLCIYQWEEYKFAFWLNYFAVCTIEFATHVRHVWNENGKIMWTCQFLWWQFIIFVCCNNVYCQGVIYNEIEISSNFSLAPRWK